MLGMLGAEEPPPVTTSAVSVPDFALALVTLQPGRIASSSNGANSCAVFLNVNVPTRVVNPVPVVVPVPVAGNKRLTRCFRRIGCFRSRVEARLSAYINSVFGS